MSMRFGRFLADYSSYYRIRVNPQPAPKPGRANGGSRGLQARTMLGTSLRPSTDFGMNLQANDFSNPLTKIPIDNPSQPMESSLSILNGRIS
jgi:hypothetical protein